MELPPSLAWIEELCKSLTAALGTNVNYRLTSTINPLVINLRLLFEEIPSSKSRLYIWNLFQIFCATNDCVSYKTMQTESPTCVVLGVIMKRRLGPEKKEHPAEK